MHSVITAQAAIIAPIMAAMVVESSVHITQLPILSIARAVNLSPTSLATPIYANARVTSQHLYSLIIITTCLLTLGSQFISTLLLSDFQNTSIASPPNSTMHRMRSDIDMLGTGHQNTNFWNQAPQAFWRFAEHHIPNQKTTPNLVDTGVTLRAAIPWLDEKSRLKLRFYAGKAPTWDARVVCFSPSFENASFVTNSSTMNIQGSLAHNMTYSPLNQSEEGVVYLVNCTMSLDSSISACKVGAKFTLDPLSQAQALGLELLYPDGTRSKFFGVLRSGMSTVDSEWTLNTTFADDQSDAEWSIRRDGP